jgi:hypothetical protein
VGIEEYWTVHYGEGRDESYDEWQVGIEEYWTVHYGEGRDESYDEWQVGKITS